MSGRCRSMAVPSHSTTRPTKPSVIARLWLMPFAALVSVVLLACTRGGAASTATATTAPSAVPPPTATQTPTPPRGTTAATGTTAAATTPPADTPELAVKPFSRASALARIIARRALPDSSLAPRAQASGGQLHGGVPLLTQLAGQNASPSCSAGGRYRRGRLPPSRSHLSAASRVVRRPICSIFAPGNCS